MNSIYEITEEEKEALAYYSSRKKGGLVNFKNYETVNKFIRRMVDGKPDLLPGLMRTHEEFKDFLNNIEKLFSIACKYGATHEIPERLYRGYDGASKLNYDSKMDRHGNAVWMSDQFLSCTRSEGETRTFSDIEIMCMDVPDTYRQLQEIPFVDVNDVLGSDQFYGDEKEILIPPFLNLMYNGEEKAGGRVYYDLEITSIVASQTREEMMNELSDDDIKAYYDLSKEYSETKNQEIKTQLEPYTKKIKSDLHNKLYDLQYKYMVEQKGNLYQSELQGIHSHR